MGRPGRSAEVEPFLRGCAWPAAPGVPYPRFDPRDMGRLPADTWQCAAIPAGVRLELVGGAARLEIDYTTATSDLGYRGEGAGTTFAVWRGGVAVDEQPAQHAAGPGAASPPAPDHGVEAPGARTAPGPTGGPAGGVASVTVDLAPERGGTAVVYLPEGLRPEIVALRALGGSVAPAPPGPRWLAYGDSLLEGWVASGPARAWGAMAARDHGLDLVNLGYAGSARGEIPCAEAIAALAADVISITHGTNCWTRTPHSAGMLREGTRAFLEIVRQGHPTTPVVLASPVLRPDAEATPNRLGATLADLRAAMEEAAAERIAAGDANLVLIPGAGVISADQLADGIHPGDDGHATMAAVFGSAVAAAARRPR